MEQKLALDNEKRDRAAELKEMKQKLALVNLKRDRETRKMPHQLEIQQLKWESRLGQLEQQISIQPRYAYTPSIMAPIDPAQLFEPPSLGRTSQTAPQEIMAGPVAGPSSRLQDTTTSTTRDFHTKRFKRQHSRHGQITPIYSSNGRCDKLGFSASRRHWFRCTTSISSKATIIT
jgi:hypothetical protein